MAWKFTLNYVDYFRNIVPRTYTLASSVVSTNDGDGYDAAAAYAASMVTAAAAISNCDVYLGGVFWKANATAPAAASAEGNVRNVLSMSFDLDGKVQRGRITVPNPTNSVVLDSNRNVNLVAVRATTFVQAFLDGDLLISDGDVADWMADADIISLRGKIETE